MLDEILGFNCFASKDELQFLLFRALPLSNGQEISDLKRYCTSNHFSIGRCIDGTLKLLEFMKLISVSDGIVTINNDVFDPAKIRQQEEYFQQGDFVRALFLALKRENVIQVFLKPDALRQDVTTRLFYVKDSLIPIRFLGIRNLLISLDFFERDLTLRSNNLFVRTNSTRLFERLVIDPLREEKQSQKRRMPLSELKDRQERREKVGEQAEIFALEFEQHRLQGHSSIHCIRRVSEEYTNAGFDIESFNDMESVFVDRFIEVKSYADDVVFYWSRNEIETAKELGENYFLYLVDRNRISQLEYAPRMFQNPYQGIFENEFWEKEPETWKVNAPRGN